MVNSGCAALETTPALLAAKKSIELGLWNHDGSVIAFFAIREGRFHGRFITAPMEI
jgi:hypothetical protein